MKTFCFTIDDNIRFFKELTKESYASLFDHPYLAMLKRLHERFRLKIQLNLFYSCDGFTLSDMSDVYRDEWEAASDWLKLSFHSYEENVSPYENADYETVKRDALTVSREILRFASDASLAKTTTVHYCKTTEDGVRALYDAGVRGLLGLYGSDEEPTSSYSLDEEHAKQLRRGKIIEIDGISHAAIDLIINKLPMDRIEAALSPLLSRESIRVMIHEQYFYPDYHAYHPDFEAKLALAFSILTEAGYSSRFFEQVVL
jgi:hypothetical protein